MTTALIAGATGLVGGQILRQLVGSSTYHRVTVVTRRTVDVPSGPAQIDQFLIDFSSLSDHADRLVADHVFCALGTTIRKAGSRERFREVDYGYALTLAQLTRRNGTTHFSLISAQGANSRSRIFYSRIKGEVERDVAALEWPSLTILRPAVIGGARREVRPAERIGQLLLRWAPKSFRTIPARVIAAAAVRSAEQRSPGVRILESRDIWDMGS